MMNQFDEFIDETDKKLNIDTSERISPSTEDRDADIAVVSGGVPASPKSPIISNTSKFNLQRQITPTRIEDHPLKIGEKVAQKKSIISSPPSSIATNAQPTVARTVVPKRRSVLMNKRRSLIQPVIAPPSESPDTFNSKAGLADDSIRTVSGSVATRKYSLGNSNIIDPEHIQLSSVHSRTSSQASSSTNVEGNDINVLLKNLASKEMDLFESKQKIEDLKKQLVQQEKLYSQHSSELQLLKSQVTKHLSENANNATSNISSPGMVAPSAFAPLTKDTKLEMPKERASRIVQPRSPETRDGKVLRNRGTGPGSRSRTVSPVNSIREVPVMNNDILDNRRAAPSDDSVWNKSFAMFNQFDQILQNELEKSLNWDSETDNDSPEKVSREHSANIFNPGTPESDKSRARQNMNPPIAQPNPSISKSLWSFVDSVRSGLLGIDENEEYEGDARSVSRDSQMAKHGTLSQPTAMKQFKTAQKSQTNKLQFIDDISDREGSSVPKNVEMADF